MPPSRSHDDYPIPTAQLSNSELEAKLSAKREAERAVCSLDKQSLGRQLWAEPALIDYAMRASEELGTAQGNLDRSLASIGLASSPEEGVEQDPAGELRIWLRRIGQQAMQLRVQSERLRSLL